MVGNVGRGMMTSPPLDSTHGRQRRAWHAITVLGQHTQSDDVGRDMPSPPFDSTHTRTTLGVACHHRLWAAHMVERCRAWHSIIAFVLAHIVGRCRAWHAIIALGRQTRSNDVGRGMPSSPLGSNYDRTASGMASNHRLWAAHRVERRRTGHAIITFWQNKWSNNVRRGMPPSLLD